MNDDARGHSRDEASAPAVDGVARQTEADAPFSAVLSSEDDPAHRWSEPGRSTRKRAFSEKPRGNSRPILVEPNDRRELLGESGLEGKAAYVLLGRPDCARLEEQPEPVQYIDFDGNKRTHTFDFRMTLRSSAMIAVAVKPYRIAVKYSLKNLLEHIARQMDPGFATGVLLLTDAQMPPYDVQNGRLFHDARRLPDRDADGRVREAITALNGATTIDGLLRLAGLDGHDQGFYAVARAIRQGLIVPVRRGLIDRDTPVHRTAFVGNAAA